VPEQLELVEFEKNFELAYEAFAFG